MKRNLSSLVAICALAWAAPAFAQNLVSPGTYYGTGNDNNNWTITTLGNLELGLRAKERGVGSIVPTGINYAALVGSSPNPNGAWWNYDFSINTQAGGGSQLLSNYLFNLRIDDNNGHVANINPVTYWADNSFWSGTEHFVYSPATDYGTQNSQNLAFGSSPLFPFFDKNANGTYTFTLTALIPSTVTPNVPFVEVASTSINVVVGTGIPPVPVPAAVWSGGALLAGLAGISYMKRRRAATAANA
jgi:hypothetical protein